MEKSKFYVDWVITNRLGLGPKPRKIDHIKILNDFGFKSILSLCSEEEAPLVENCSEYLDFYRSYLPDHKANRNPSENELLMALSIYNKIKNNGPVYVHCVASVERSPLLCLAILIQDKKLKFQDALDYLMQVHPQTNPLIGQLKLLDNFN